MLKKREIILNKELGFNPWFNILVRPKKTLRAILEHNPNYGLFILSFVYGFTSIAGLIQNMRLGATIGLYKLMIMLIIIAPIWGYIFFCISSWFVFHIGKWFSGRGAYKEIRAAVAWSNVPNIVTFLIWIFLIIIFKKDLFSNVIFEPIKNKMLSNIFLTVMVIQFVANIWMIVLYFVNIAEAHQFSIWKSFFTIILWIVASILLFFIVSIVAKGIISLFLKKREVVFLDKTLVSLGKLFRT